MTDFVLPPPRRPSVAIAGSHARFPVRRVFCVGRNYAAHAREMGKDPAREPPFFFMKPPDALVDAGEHDDAVIPYPPLTSELHHEVELAVALHQGGRDVDLQGALDLVYGYAVALDLTRRDLQKQAKQMGRPWDWGKGFDASAPIGPLVAATAAGALTQGRIWLTVDDEIRQDANLSELIWSIPEILTEISRSVALAPGDVILTGTPAGVGPLSVGQIVRGPRRGPAECAVPSW